MPQKGERYRHYKGNEYEIVCVAVSEADAETQLVIYQDLSDPSKIWARPLQMFMEKVVVEGTEQQRFSRME